MGFWRKAVRVVLRALVALPVVFSAEVARTWLLEARGLGIPFLTFYPAVLLAAALGGLPGGLMAALLSGLLAVFRIDHGRIPLADGVALGIFLVSAVWISAMARSGPRAGSRAGQALADPERAREDPQASSLADTSSAKLEALIHAIPDLVWLKDAEGVYQDCNEPFERFFALDREAILGRTDYELVDLALARAFREGDLRVMATGEPAQSEETIALSPGQPAGLLETIRTPIRDRTGMVVGLLGFGRDITQRKRDEDQIRRMTETLDQQVEEPAARDPAAAGGSPRSRRSGNLNDLLNPMLAEGWDGPCRRLDLGAPALQAIADLSRGPGGSVRAILTAGLDPDRVSAAVERSLRIAEAFTRDLQQTGLAAPDAGAEDGLDLAYAHKLFDAFQRLHGSQDFERIRQAAMWANFCWISSSEKGLVIAKV